MGHSCKHHKAIHPSAGQLHLHEHNLPAGKTRTNAIRKQLGMWSLTILMNAWLTCKYEHWAGQQRPPPQTTPCQ